MKHTHRRTFPGLQRIGQSNKGTSHALRNGIIAVALALAGTSAAMGAARVGPIDPENGFPLFYEDANGLRLELCTDLANCFFLPPDPGAPVSGLNNFPDEAFYWAAESIMSDATTGSNAILVMAREAAFFNDAVIDGDQIVFSRIRLYIDGAPQMVGNHYTVTHPYGTVEFDSVAGDAGPGVTGEGLSTTIDVGITEPGAFADALGEFPVFLTPVGSAGTLSAGTFMIDSSATGAGTELEGSPEGTNFFRIEGPEISTVYNDYQCADAALGGGTDADGNRLPGVKDAFGADVLTDCVELNLFAIQGRVATRHGVDIDKATYEKNGTLVSPNTYVNVFAHSVEGQQLIASVDNGTQIEMIEGLGTSIDPSTGFYIGTGNYFIRLQGEGTHFTYDPTGVDYDPTGVYLRKPVSVTVSNITDLVPSIKTRNITDQVSITMATLDNDGGTLTVKAQSSNKVGDSLLTVEPFPGGIIPTVYSVANGSIDADVKTVSVPPMRVAVSSDDGGYAIRDVEIIGLPSSGGTIPLTAIAGADQTVVAGTTVNFSGALSMGNIASYNWVSGILPSGVTFSCDSTNCSQISVVTPDPLVGANQEVINFTLTVTDVNTNVLPATDTVQLTINNSAAVIADDCTIVTAEYRADKDQWRVEGTSTVPANQLISIYLGLSAITNPIGTTRVDAVGVWAFRTGRGEAFAIPAAGQRLWIESALGCYVDEAVVIR